jgi:sterol desaturase/sphingolipid hydroxylase (fatty acid hydroxylase superfamily)
MKFLESPQLTAMSSGVRRPGALLRAVVESRFNYAASYAIDLACPLVLGYLAFRQTPGWAVGIACVGAGLGVFSFAEYAIHRWLFHARSGVMGAMHQAHHDTPHDHVALPCVTSVAVAVLAWQALSAVVDPGKAGFFLCGLMSGYLYYGALHHFEHSIRITAVPFRWLQRRWAMHSVHHRMAHTNYGVTTSVWDRVFATHHRSRRRARSQAGGLDPSEPAHF